MSKIKKRPPRRAAKTKGSASSKRTARVIPEIAKRTKQDNSSDSLRADLLWGCAAMRPRSVATPAPRSTCCRTARSRPRRSDKSGPRRAVAFAVTSKARPRDRPSPDHHPGVDPAHGLHRLRRGSQRTLQLRRGLHAKGNTSGAGGRG